MSSRDRSWWQEPGHTALLQLQCPESGVHQNEREHWDKADFRLRHERDPFHNLYVKRESRNNKKKHISKKKYFSAFANDTFDSSIGDFGLPDTDLQMSCTTFSMTDSPSLNRQFGFNKINDTYLVPETVYEVFNFRKFAQVAFYYLWIYTSIQKLSEINRVNKIVCSLSPSAYKSVTTS